MRKWLLAIFLIAAPVVAPTPAHAHDKPSQCFSSVEDLRQTFKSDHAWRMTIKGNICWHVHGNTISKNNTGNGVSRGLTVNAKEVKPKEIIAPVRPEKISPQDHQRMRDYLGMKCDNPFNFDEFCLNWR